jgi:fibronectin type 3 domain-containing protein
VITNIRNALAGARRIEIVQARFYAPARFGIEEEGVPFDELMGRASWIRGTRKGPAKRKKGRSCKSGQIMTSRKYSNNLNGWFSSEEKMALRFAKIRPTDLKNEKSRTENAPILRMPRSFHQSHSFSLCSVAAAFLLLLGFLSQTQAVQSVTLAWDANTEPNLAGYSVHYGTSAGAYTQTVDVGTSTTATLNNLSDGVTYFIAVTALNTLGLESLPSAEITFAGAANQPPSVNLTSPASGSQFTAPADIAIGASANDSDGSIARVEFYSGGAKLGEDTTGPFAFAWNGVPAGTYAISVVAFDNQGVSTQSATANVTVNVPLPLAATGLNATAVSTSQINLNWAASSGAASYNVKRSTTSGGPYTTVASGVTATSFSNTGLSAQTTYHYVVSAVNGSGESANSAQASATTQAQAVPGVPSSLSATATSTTQINLNWTASSGAASYNIKRSNTSGGPYTTIATGVTATTYSNTGLTPQTTYHYVVSAVNAGGESANSAQASATTLSVPAVPTGLTATAGDSQVLLSWTASGGANGYNVKQATASGGPYTTVASAITATSHTATGLTNGVTYYFVVSAVNTAGESANSVQAAATPNAGLPSPWVNVDVGTVSATGTATSSNGIFTIDGSGASISSRNDEFQYVYQTAGGDCSVIARVADIENTHSQAKAGIMIRETTSGRSRYAAVLVTPGSGVQFQRRTSTGGTTATSTANGITAPRWIRLTRTGNTLRAYHSTNGTTWTQFGGNRTVVMATTTTMGLAVCSRVDGTLCTATMDNVTASP